MLDIKFVRENPEVVKQNIRNKFQDSKLELVDKVIELDKENIKVETYDSSSRQIPPKADVKEQAKTFRDLSQSLTEEQVKKETSRCLSCGASVVDPNKCIGCGVCTTKCMFDAIHLHREIPGASIMRASEDKLKYILPNMVKQSIKVKFKKKK